MTTVPAGNSGSIEIRAMVPGDTEEILSILSVSLGWRNDDAHRQLFAWKHKLSPFGTSPGWVAEDEAGIVGFRTFLRWEFDANDVQLSAVRAVDTATHPRARGHGIFRALTERAVADMRSEGVNFVFNTPNPQSAAGYFSMGWEKIGRVPVSFRPARMGIIRNMLSARAAGDLWSMPTSFGDAAEEVLADIGAVTGLLSSERSTLPSKKIRTNRTADYLLWRYGKCPIGYRAVLAGAGVADGMLLFRLRRRGAATEAVVAEVIISGEGAARRARVLIRTVLEATNADYAIAVGSSRPRTWVPVWRNGPLLTWRRLNWPGPTPVLGDWDLATGDIELF